jgi:23S rRNA (pseudouridine1915-N3)-methyltransferase
VKLFVLFIGKERDPHANAMAQDFVQRTSRFAQIQMREIRPDRFDPWERHPSARKICLDPAGRVFDSRTFVKLVEDAEREGRDLVFVIGGHDGLPPAWRSRADLLLSLSAMTFPHELARVCLAEQIYRAYTTLRGHPYPR